MTYGNNIKNNILTNYKASQNSTIERGGIVTVRIQFNQLIDSVLIQLNNELHYGINL